MYDCALELCRISGCTVDLHGFMVIQYDCMTRTVGSDLLMQTAGSGSKILARGQVLHISYWNVTMSRRYRTTIHVLECLTVTARIKTLTIHALLKIIFNLIYPCILRLIYQVYENAIKSSNFRL